MASDRETWQVVVNEVCVCIIKVRHHLLTGLHLIERSLAKILQSLSQQCLTDRVLTARHQHNVFPDFSLVVERR